MDNRYLIESLENELNQGVYDCFEGDQFGLYEIKGNNQTWYLARFYNGMYGNMCSILYDLEVYEHDTYMLCEDGVTRLHFDDPEGLYELFSLLTPDKTIDIEDMEWDGGNYLWQFS